MIPIGCTSENSFAFPYNENEVACVYITYVQGGNTVVEKELPDCKFEDGRINVMLSQEDSLLFEEKTNVRIQIRGRKHNNKAFKSTIITASTDEILKKGVI